jgi:hypothetical protein
VGHPLTYRASPLKYSALTLYLVGLQGSTGSDRLRCAILPRLMSATFVEVTVRLDVGLSSFGGCVLKAASEHQSKGFFISSLSPQAVHLGSHNLNCFSKAIAI